MATNDPLATFGAARGSNATACTANEPPCRCRGSAQRDRFRTTSSDAPMPRLERSAHRRPHDRFCASVGAQACERNRVKSITRGDRAARPQCDRERSSASGPALMSRGVCRCRCPAVPLCAAVSGCRRTTRESQRIADQRGEVRRCRGSLLVEAVKGAIWELRAEGVSEAEIARRLVMPKRTVGKYLQRMGGIRPRPRRRAECCLTLVEREEISRGIARGDSARAIGRTLGRSHTTVSREINRCGGRGRYRAHAAEQTAWGRARRPRATKLEVCPELREVVIERLEQDHSPQQISGWLRLSYPTMIRCRSRTRRSTARCTSRRAGRCDANLPGICEPGVRSATHGRTPIAGRAPAASPGW